MIFFELQPYEIKTIATRLSINVAEIRTDGVDIDYVLSTSDNKELERGKKIVPLAAMALLSEMPVDVTALNQLLSQWGITAIQQEG